MVTPLMMPFRSILPRALIHFLIYSAIFAGLLWLVWQSAYSVTLKEYLHDESQVLDLAIARIEGLQNHVVEDLLFLTDHERTGGKDGRRAKPEDLDLEEDCTTLMKVRGSYDQISLLDPDGKAVLEVNYMDGKPQPVPAGRLEDRSSWDVYRQARILPPGRIHVSRLELDADKGGVKKPWKPVMRYAIALRDADNRIEGVLVMTFQARQILELLQETAAHEGEETFLLNRDGYYLLGPGSVPLWGFMFPDEKDGKFPDDHPEIWRAIRDQYSGFISDSRGDWFHHSADPLLMAQQSPDSLLQREKQPELDLPRHDSWQLVCFVPNHVRALRFSLPDQMVVFSLLVGLPCLMLLALTVAWNSARNHALRRKLENTATYDNLTGIYNRGPGLSFLGDLLALSVRRNTPLTLAFLDANNLKIINDRFGHEEGDRFICALVGVLKKSIRSSDFLIRMGGDEFLAAFPDCDTGTARRILESSLDHLEASARAEETVVPWNFSYGLSNHLEDDTKNLDELIKRADFRMYQHKHAWKKNNERPQDDSTTRK